jgi:hypothetical protein
MERRAIRCNGCEEDESMRSFVFGGMVGAIVMYFYLQGFGPIVHTVQGWWVQVSAPHANALQQ